MLCFNSLMVSPIRSGETKIGSELVIDQIVGKKTDVGSKSNIIHP